MKKIYTLIAGIMLTASIFAQAPEKMSYQGVVRDASNALVTTQAVGMQISILQGGATGTPVYVETQTPTTNSNGLLSLEIGTGTLLSGDFTTINWANDTYFIKTETDPTGGTNYTITGTTQLMSVPYALHAKTAESITGTINYTETDPIFRASIANTITAIDTANWRNHTVDTDTHIDSTGVANLGFNAGGIITETDPVFRASIANGITVIDTANWNNHTVDTDTHIDSTGVANLGFNAGAIITEIDPVFRASIANGITAIDTVNWNNKLSTEIDGSVTNEIQVLTISNDTLFLSKGGLVKLPAAAVVFSGNYADLTNIPAYIADGDDNTQLNETQVDAFVANNGYLTTEVDGSVTNEIELPTGGTNGQVLKTDGGGNYAWVNQTTDTDTNTQLNETQVDAFVANNGYLTTEVDGSVTNEIELPTGGTNGQVLKTNGSGNYAWVNQTTDTDTDTQLNETQVDAFVANNGYLTTEVDGSVTNEIELPTGGTNGQVLKTNGSGNYAWVNQTTDTDTDTQLNETQVDAFVANNGYLTTEVDGSVTNEIELPTGGTNEQVLKTDGSGNYAWVNQTTDTDTHIDSTGIANLGYMAGMHTVNTDAQTLTVSQTGDTLTISGGNYVLVPGISLLNHPHAQVIQIGDFYAGGVVFWLDGNGGGLVVSVADQSTSATWGCNGIITGSDSTAIGTGAQNTVDIEASCATAGTAADICANLTLNSYNDWFLPSKDALQIIYDNRVTIDATAANNSGTSLSLDRYWSSTEFNSNNAWTHSFNNGVSKIYLKPDNYTCRVRAVRAF
ncbi:DUF1566 domain-containing protein [Polaribacter sp. ALD11]|uniref:Lcl domain-containing protein n=1 Tax=Polaribacter sp. ALD11 TaxID=2058137 RepID=UPI0012FDA8D3|nr:DUF1566 domain-containing protein [Polaribacter sp. ALD11]